MVTTEPDRRRYRLHACVGRGDLGEVYRATMHSGGGVRTEVAVKVLHDLLDPAGPRVRQIRDEALLVGLIDHPSVLKIYDWLLLDGRGAMVTELVRGDDLEVCCSEAPLPARVAVEIVGRVADALHTAWHAEGADGTPLNLIHRDIKPTHIRVGPHGDVKLLDFGIARGNPKSPTPSDTKVDRLGYRAPECLANTSKMSQASDIYALGATLYEGLVGRPLRDGDPRQVLARANERAMHDAHVAACLTSLEAPEPLAQLLQAMLNHDPTKRPDPLQVAQTCTYLVEEAYGPSLRRWCRERDWSTHPCPPGLLDGRVFPQQPRPTAGAAKAEVPRPSEARKAPTPSPPLRAKNAATPRPSPPPRATEAATEQGESPHRPSRTLAFIFVAASVALFGSATLAGVSYLTEATTEPSPATKPLPPPAVPRPVADAPRPEPVAAAAAPSRPRAPAAEVIPDVVELPPAEGTDPTPASLEPATVGCRLIEDSDVPVQLRVGSTVHTPGELPAGSYAIWAKFDGEWKNPGQFTCNDGRDLVLRCTKTHQRCAVQG